MRPAITYNKNKNTFTTNFNNVHLLQLILKSLGRRVFPLNLSISLLIPLAADAHLKGTCNVWNQYEIKLSEILSSAHEVRRFPKGRGKILIHYRQ
jgi:hypothetical protein